MPVTAAPLFPQVLYGFWFVGSKAILREKMRPKPLRNAWPIPCMFYRERGKKAPGKIRTRTNHKPSIIRLHTQREATVADGFPFILDSQSYYTRSTRATTPHGARIACAQPERLQRAESHFTMPLFKNGFDSKRHQHSRPKFPRTSFSRHSGYT